MSLWYTFESHNPTSECVWVMLQESPDFKRCFFNLVIVCFRPPGGDYRLTSLQTVKDVVYINLFDEYVTDVVQVNNNSDVNVSEILQKRELFL